MPDDYHGHKQYELNGMFYRIVWETNTLASPYGVTVIAVNLSKPRHYREIFRKEGEPYELGQIIHEADEAIKHDALGK